MAADGRGQRGIRRKGWLLTRMLAGVGCKPVLRGATSAARSPRGGGRPWLILALAVAGCLFTSPTIDLAVGQSPAAASQDLSCLSVTLIADGQQRQISSDKVTAAELLASAGIALSELDRVQPGLEEMVSHESVVQVVRVTRELVTQEIEIPVETQMRYDRRVRRPITVHEGSPGRAQVQVEVWTRDGEETLRKIISRQVLEPMTPREVLRGHISLPSRGGEVIYMEATGYDPGPRSCGRYASGWTAIGLRAGKGVVAVDPRVIPLGTRLYVEGYGECVAGDVGSAIKGRRIDLGFDTYREALAWGRRTVKVRILE